MAIRLERSGELMFIRGTADEPEKPRNGKKYIQRAFWLVVMMLAGGVLFMGPHALLSMATVNHALRAILTAIW